MSIDIATKGPLLESFYLKLEQDGWNFTECTDSGEVITGRGADRWFVQLDLPKRIVLSWSTSKS